MYLSLQSASLLLIAVFTGMALALPRSVAAQADMHHDTRPSVSVSGEGRVRVEPDMAIVRFGVVSVADDPVQAREQNAEASSRALNAIREMGIEERYIKMESLRLEPNREWVGEPRRDVERREEAMRIVVVRL